MCGFVGRGFMADIQPHTVTFKPMIVEVVCCSDGQAAALTGLVDVMMGWVVGLSCVWGLEGHSSG